MRGSKPATDGRPLKHLIVIPAFNEEQALPGTIAALDRLSAEFEVLIVNDGSGDRTAQVAREAAEQSEHAVHVIDLPMNCGIGAAVQSGFRFAARQGGYHYVVQFDADGQHDADSIERLIAAATENEWDLCVGSRFLTPVENGYRSTRVRRLGIRFFAMLISQLAGTRVTDPTSGFRCSGPRVWKAFADRYPDDYPEPESLFWCARNHLAIGEIPVRMHPRSHGNSSIDSLRSIYYMLKVTLAILVDRVRGREFFA